MLINFKDEDFDNKIKKEDVSVIQFSAAWCGPCKALKPVMDKLADEYKGKAGFYYADIEDGGELVEDDNGVKYKDFYGMSSTKAQQTYYGDLAEHRAPEGKKVRLKYKGPLDNTVQAILGGVRSACSYVGAKTLKDLPKCTTFIRVTQTTNEVFTTFENN